MSTIEAYLDESGITQGQLCLVGGYVGGYRQIRRLEQRWSQIVSCLPDKDFHAKDFFARRNGQRVGPFKHWTDAHSKE
ncbi:MAG TPA: hypothetical protein VMU24_14180 [Candidatus Acidoferrales bacterium]|nr:hypothetical protein [Candidatus Acidoferrales bacterium]